ncbi:MAG: glycosyltransferase family 4 protein [Gammaproteobacteria bacterium]
MDQSAPLPRVVQIGFHKCGTRSLEQLFRGADHRVVKFKVRRRFRRSRIAALLIRDNLQAGRKAFTGFEDFTFYADLIYQSDDDAFEPIRHFREIMRDYPDTILLLNVRRREDWIKSRLKHGHGEFLRRVMRQSGTDSVEEIVSAWRDEWETHLAEVRASRFSGRKGFHVLIDAIALLRDRGVAVECAIAGEGRTRAELEKQIANRGVSGSVGLVGWLDNVQKVRFLEGLDLFVSPSLNEPFGFVYLDAMRVGAPIIACPTVGARYIFSTPGTAEIVPLDDAPARADAIERVLSDNALRLALGAKAERAFAARFSLEAGAKNLQLALAQMTSLKRRPS